MPSTYTVTNLNDSGTGSLRAAITSANGSSGNTINFAALIGTITLASSLTAITQPMTITGPSAYPNQVSINAGGYTALSCGVTGLVTISNLCVTGSTISGQTCNFASSSNLVLSGMSFISNNPTSAVSALIYNSGATITLSNCLFWSNSGQSLFYGSGSLTVNNCSFIANTMAAGTGAIFWGPTTTCYECLFQGNTGQISSYTSGGQNVSYTSCAMIGNTVPPSAIGQFISSSGGTATLLNCTVTGNAITGSVNPSFAQGSTVTVTNCTITNNTSNYGLFSSSATIKNSIVYGNSLTGSPSTVTYSCFQGGYAGTGNISTNPNLGSPFGDIAVGSPYYVPYPVGWTLSGGAQTIVPTVPLGPTSPCLGAGTATGAPSTDGRGVTRPNPPSMGAWDTTPHDGSLYPGTGANMLTAQAVPGDSIILTWGAVWAASYDIWRGTGGALTLYQSGLSASSLLNAAGTALTWTDTGLSTGTTYYYKVAVHGGSNYTNTASATAILTGPFAAQPFYPDAKVQAGAAAVKAHPAASMAMNAPVCTPAYQQATVVISPAIRQRRLGYGSFGPGE